MKPLISNLFKISASEQTSAILLSVEKIPLPSWVQKGMMVFPKKS